jgi:hypothetical protein
MLLNLQSEFYSSSELCKITPCTNVVPESAFYPVPALPIQPNSGMIGSKRSKSMKYLVLTLLVATAALPATPVRADEEKPEWTGFLNMIYARPFGIKSVADQADKQEKPKNRLGTGLIVLMPNGGSPILPSKPPPDQELGQ